MVLYKKLLKYKWFIVVFILRNGINNGRVKGLYVKF